MRFAARTSTPLFRWDRAIGEALSPKDRKCSK
jgi:hypothetical protein